MSTEKQVGGDHYSQFNIQPIDYIVANGLSFLAGNVVKYVTRHQSKNGAEDIRKAIHYLEMILEFEYGINKTPEKVVDPYLKKVNKATPQAQPAEQAHCPAWEGPQSMLGSRPQECF